MVDFKKHVGENMEKYECTVLKNKMNPSTLYSYIMLYYISFSFDFITFSEGLAVLFL